MSKPDFPELVGALGEVGFAPLLLAFARRLTGADHLSVISFDRALAPVVSLTQSADGSSTAREAGRRYCASTLNSNDPIRGRMLRARSDDTPIVSRLSLADMIEEPERLDFYRQFALTERWSVLGNRGGRWIALNLYRGTSPAPPGAEARLVASAPLLHALVVRHMRFKKNDTAGGDPFTALVARIEPQLTPREQQVCALALLGLTNAEIARDLGIGVATVSTLRRRAYYRLGISSLAELFGRCLAQRDA